MNKRMIFLYFLDFFSYSVSLKSDILLYTVDKIIQLNPPLPSKTSTIWPDEMTSSLWRSGASFGKIETCDSRLSLKPGKSNRDESSFHYLYLNSLLKKKKQTLFEKWDKIVSSESWFGVTASPELLGVPARCVSISSMSSCHFTPLSVVHWSIT